MALVEIPLSRQVIERLDLSPVRQVMPEVPDPDWTVRFVIDYPRDPSDPRELSEVPEVRLWFIRLDAHYPWLPLFLDWQGELAQVTYKSIPTDWLLYSSLLRQEILLSPVICDRSLQPKLTLSFSHTSQVL
jgi:hypothetical protein